MKIKLFFILPFFLFTIISNAQVHQSHWQSMPVSIDGDDKDWEKPLHLYNTNTGLLFSIANDNKSLYICFEANEKQKMHKLMHAGWDLELSSKDKKAKFTSTIIFPAIAGQMNNSGHNKTDYSAGSVESKKGKFDINEMIDSYRLRLSNISTKGFTTQNGTLSVNNSTGIKAGIGNNGENIVFEFAIPLSELSTNDLFDVKELQLNVTVNALDKTAIVSRGDEGYKHKSDGFGGFDKGGGGQRGGGGHGGGNHSYGNTAEIDHATLFEKSTFKQKFLLAKNHE
ncbi:MAG: hypothetical protein JWN78_871 [Bacteroidota bacterium]|nr:hypothetical protein [Bacteroidota bacterium]